MRGRNLSRVWLWSFVLWTAFGIIDATEVVFGMRAEGMHHPWVRLFSVFTLSWTVWAVASPLVLWLGKRLAPLRYWPVHAAAYIAIGLIHGLWFVWLELAFEPFGGPSGTYNLIGAIKAFFYTRFHVDLIAYVVVLGAGQALESRRRLAEREEQLSKARLDALRHQLEPHFLFNTLNGISGLVRSGENQTAVEMIAGFSDLLRRVIEGEAGNAITLAEELAFVKKYLGIQQMRFGSRLRFEVDVPAEVAGARVPGLILQPVVENAIEHGISRRLQGGVIRIRARRVSGRLTMSVDNDGPALNGAGEGVGITNTRARLNNLYGERGVFELRDKVPDCVEATITVPYEV